MTIMRKLPFKIKINKEKQEEYQLCDLALTKNRINIIMPFNKYPISNKVQAKNKEHQN